MSSGMIQFGWPAIRDVRIRAHRVLNSFCVLACIGFAGAQTPSYHFTQQDAERLALNAPPIFDPWSRSCCAMARATRIDAETIWIEVRCSCGEDRAGHLFDHFTVNTNTGNIWQGFEQKGKPLESERLRWVRSKILQSRR